MFKLVRSVVIAGGTGGMVSTFGIASPSKKDEAWVGNDVTFVARVCSQVGTDWISAISCWTVAATAVLAAAAD